MTRSARGRNKRTQRADATTRGAVRGVMLATLVAVSVASGCAKVDATGDVAQAGAEVERRAGVAPGWNVARALPEAPEIPARLTATEAAAIAVRNDARVRAGVQRVAAARADLAQAGLLPNPVLAVELGFPIAGTDASTKTGFGLTAQLVSLLTRGDRVKAADAALRAEVLALSDRALEAAARARIAHARLRSAQALRGPLEAMVREAERADEALRGRQAAGEASQLEVNRERLALGRLRSQADEGRLELALRSCELLAALGAPGAGVEVEAVDNGVPADDVTALEEAALERVVGENRLDVAAARAEAEAAWARVGVARGERFGEVGVGAGYERTEDGSKLLGPTLELGVPIFDTGAARVARGVAEARRLEAEAEAVRREAVASARQAWVRARETRALADRYEREFVALAEANIRTAEAAYAAGQADVAVTIDARTALVEARVRLVELRERAEIAAVELRRAVGR